MPRMTKAILDQIETYAAIQMQPEEIATLLQIDPQTFMDTKSAAKAYETGRCKGKAHSLLRARKISEDDSASPQERAQALRLILTLNGSLAVAAAKAEPTGQPVSGPCQECLGVIEHLAPVISAMGLPIDGGAREIARLAAYRLREHLAPTDARGAYERPGK